MRPRRDLQWYRHMNLRTVLQQGYLRTLPRLMIPTPNNYLQFRITHKNNLSTFKYAEYFFWKLKKFRVWILIRYCDLTLNNTNKILNYPAWLPKHRTWEMKDLDISKHTGRVSTLLYTWGVLRKKWLNINKPIQRPLIVQGTHLYQRDARLVIIMLVV